MACALLYLADQDPTTTSSLGIFNYSRRLVREFSRIPDPGFRLVLLVAAGNRHDFVPEPLPEWMTVEQLPGPPRGTGLPRLWCDHVGVLRAARRHHARMIHFPKGWLPLRHPPGLRFLATIHDAIPEYYSLHHRAHTRPAKRAYFGWAIRHSLRQADVVVTDSNASRDHLTSLVPEAESKCRTIWLGPGISTSGPPRQRDSLLVLGSRQPHKATAQTLRLLSAWMTARKDTPRLRITGLKGWPDAWGDAPALPEATWLGRLSDEQLAEEYARTRALVLLSEIEGFGLPALEGVLSGAAVCYRNVSSVAELMQGAPGAWDGVSEDGFFKALDEALTASPQVWAGVAARLERDCRWDAAASSMLRIYSELLN